MSIPEAARRQPFPAMTSYPSTYKVVNVQARGSGHNRNTSKHGIVTRPRPQLNFVNGTKITSKQNASRREIINFPSGADEDSVDYSTLRPQSMQRPRRWDDKVEENYRFQMAGYRDEVDYIVHNSIKKPEVVRWPDSGYIKKLQKRDGNFYYYNRLRECSDKDINKVKIYFY